MDTYFYTENNIFYSSDSIIPIIIDDNANYVAVYDIATGIKKSTINEIIKIYPNPASNILQIEIQSNQNTSITLNIIDTKGSLMETKTITNSNDIINTSFNVSKLAKGNYLLNLYDEAGMVSYKFIVE